MKGTSLYSEALHSAGITLARQQLDNLDMQFRQECRMALSERQHAQPALIVHHGIA